MNKRKLHIVGKPCRGCLPDLRHTLLDVDEIMKLPTTDSPSFSLKVYAAAYFIGMQEYTGSACSPEALGLLKICAEEIARRHTIFVKVGGRATAV